jgi:hypothetical protein
MGGQSNTSDWAAFASRDDGDRFELRRPMSSRRTILPLYANLFPVMDCVIFSTNQISIFGVTGEPCASNKNNTAPTDEAP